MIEVKGEEQYLELLRQTITEGGYVEDRTGTGCYSIFGAVMKFDLQKGFPLLTTKKINFNNIVGELLWFCSGYTDLTKLREFSDKPEDAHTIWSDDYAKYVSGLDESERTGCLGNIYGHQWRGAFMMDQLETLIENINVVKAGDPYMARRLIVQSWNPTDHILGDKVWAALPACHTDFQCLVRDGKLNLKFNCRSNDAFLGTPYNIASYALLCHILASICGLQVGELLYTGVDFHVYSNHVDQVKLQLEREPRDFPELVMPHIESLEDLDDLTAKDFTLVGYNPHPFISAPQAS